MGYLSQKKHETRINIFLYMLLLIVASLSLLSFSVPGFKIGFFNLLHLYVISFCLIIYSVVIKRYKIALIFALFFLVNYTILSSSINIFFPDTFIGVKNIKLKFGPDVDLSKEFLNKKETSGAIILAKKFVAPYVVIKDNDVALTMVMVDFRGATKEQYYQIFNQLHQFVIKQDDPIIIFGEFGLPAWSRYFKEFLNISGLSIKNNLIFTQSSVYNFFTTPSFYVLGFQEMGVSHIETSNINGKKVITVDISFNPAHF